MLNIFQMFKYQISFKILKEFALQLRSVSAAGMAVDVACRGAGARAPRNDLSLARRGCHTSLWGVSHPTPGSLTYSQSFIGCLVQWACPLWLLSHIPNLTMKGLQIPTGIPEILVSLVLVMNPNGFVSLLVNAMADCR